MNKITEMEKELLADMEENPVEYRGINNTFEIDSDLRTINIPVTVKNIGVESDDDVKRLEFTMQKQYGEFDLSQFRIRINYMNANGDKSIYLVEDKKVSGDNITFSWLIGRDVTKYKGQVNFIVCLKLSDEKGKVLKELNTTLCRLDVLEGLEVVPVIDQKTTDLIEQLLKMVETETTGAVQKVTEEGVKQIAEVQKAAQEIIDDREQIQANKKGIETLTQSKANAIINTAKGDKIAVSDSSDLQIDNLKLFGKSKQLSSTGAQLFDASKLQDINYGGATVTNNRDGSFTISGNGNISSDVGERYVYSNEVSKRIVKPGTIYLRCGQTSYPYTYVSLSNSSGELVQLTNSRTDLGSFVLTEEMIEDKNFKITIGIYGVKGNTIRPGIIKPMLYQDGDGTWELYTDGKPAPNPDYPIDITNVGNDGKVDVSVQGKNLFDASKLQSATTGGATVINNGDGSFTIEGSSALDKMFKIVHSYTPEQTKKIVKSGILKLSCGNLSNPYLFITIFNSTGRVAEITNSYKEEDSVEITGEMINNEQIRLDIGFYGIANSNIKKNIIKPMLYQDGDGTWESFKPLQNLSIQTQNGLCGLPVESNGNYTDNKEKQWACDEIDLKRGKKKSYVKRITLNGTEKWVLQSINEHGIANFSIPLSGENKPSNKNLLSTHFIKQDTTIAETSEEGILINYGAPMYFRVKQERASTADGFKTWLSENPVTIMYDLETPIQTNLTPEEIADYKQLHTNYPSTVIQNDEGAGMEISYVADTKLYTDNKIKDAVSKQMQNIADLLYLMPEEIQAKMIETDTNNILEDMEVQKHE